MTTDKAREIAQEAFDRSAQMGPGHAETARGAELAGVILALVNQLEPLQEAVTYDEEPLETSPAVLQAVLAIGARDTAREATREQAHAAAVKKAKETKQPEPSEYVPTPARKRRKFGKK